MNGQAVLHTRSARYGKLLNGTRVGVPPSCVARQAAHIVTLQCGVLRERSRLLLPFTSAGVEKHFLCWLFHFGRASVCKGVCGSSNVFSYPVVSVYLQVFWSLKPARGPAAARQVFVVLQTCFSNSVAYLRVFWSLKPARGPAAARQVLMVLGRNGWIWLGAPSGSASIDELNYSQVPRDSG